MVLFFLLEVFVLPGLDDLVLETVSLRVDEVELGGDRTLRFIVLVPLIVFVRVLLALRLVDFEVGLALVVGRLAPEVLARDGLRAVLGLALELFPGLGLGLVHVREDAEDLVGDVSVVWPVEFGGLPEHVVAVWTLDLDDVFVVGLEVLPPDVVCGKRRVLSVNLARSSGASLRIRLETSLMAPQ